MRILNMTVRMGNHHNGEMSGEVFQMMLGDNVLCEEETEYARDLDDAEYWAAHKLKELFDHVN